ncbi:MAG: fused MFS/spermidine synthase [Acidobacteriota bacterium]
MTPLDPSQDQKATIGSNSYLYPALLTCFFLSGATALVYEVLWVRMLLLRLGSTGLAVSTVVSAYMAGLAFGAHVAGRLSRRLRRPLAVYALLELGIAGSALLIPSGLSAMDPVHRVLWQTFEPQYLTFSLLQFASAFLLLFVPTALMGATLPLLSQAVVRQTDHVGRRVGALYGINTLGAVLGTVLTGFVLLPQLGISRTLLATAAVNLLLAAGAGALNRITGTVSAERELTPPQSEPEGPEGGGSLRERWLRIAVLAALVVSGFTSMVYQVAWTRTLSLVIGSSAYGFTIVLATFLVGIALGALVLSRFVERLGGALVWWIVAAQAMIGFAAYATSSIVNRLPYYFTRGFHWLDAEVSSVHLLSFALAALVLFPSTFVMGSMFPLAVQFFSRSARGVGRLVGNLYSLNTVGAILGAFTGGFVLLAHFGIRTTLVSAIGMNLCVAALVALFLPVVLRIRLVAALGLVGLLSIFMIVPPGWNSLLMSSRMFQYAHVLEKDFTDDDFWRITEGNYDLLFYEEGLTSTISILFDGSNVLLVNSGKIDASNHSDIDTQLLLGHVPLLFHPEPRDVCVIGMGSGMTAGSALTHPIRSLVLLEIEEAVLNAASFFDDVNNRPLEDARTEAVTADGRNYLMMTDRQFDVIISEPPNPWMSGVSNLFTREFFEIARQRLRPEGVLGQWLELYSLSPEDLRAILASFTSVFPHVQIFGTIEETDLLVVGSAVPLPLDVEALEKRMSSPEVARDLNRVNVGKVAELLSFFKIGESEIQSLAAGSPLNTDDNAKIEFSAPWYLYVDTGALNWELLDDSTAGPMPYLTGLNGVEERVEFLISLEEAYRERGRPQDAERVQEALLRLESPSEQTE